MRTAEITRTTKETDISVKLNLDGSGRSEISTGIAFLDHMLTLFSKHGLFDLTIQATGDLEVDTHHTNEDIGLALREAVTKALGDKRGIRRFGAAFAPMGSTLARVVVDISGRPGLAYSFAEMPISATGTDYTMRDALTFFEAFTAKGELDLHIDLLKVDNEDVHHALEAIFKALAKALDMATQNDSRQTGIPSTKGIL